MWDLQRLQKQMRAICLVAEDRLFLATLGWLVTVVSAIFNEKNRNQHQNLTVKYEELQQFLNYTKWYRILILQDRSTILNDSIDCPMDRVGWVGSADFYNWLFCCSEGSPETLPLVRQGEGQFITNAV